MKKEVIFQVLLIGFLSLFFNSCNDGSNGSSGSKGSNGLKEQVTSLKYSGTDIDGIPIEIEITRPNGRAALNPQNNDYYKVRKNGQEVSSGKIKKGEKAFVFEPDSGFPYGAEIVGNTIYVPIVHDNSVGISADSNSNNVSNVFNVTSANFDSTIKSIRDVPGEYVINLSDDLIDYHGTNIDKEVKITIKGTGTNKITWIANENSPLFSVDGGYLILENINISGTSGNSEGWPLLCVYSGTIAIRDNVTISNDSGDPNAFDSGVMLKNGAFIMTGGEITGFWAAVDAQEDESSLVITGGKISDCDGSGIAFTGSNAFLSIEGGEIINNNVGIYMTGSDNQVVISGGTIRNNTEFGFNIGGSRNMTTMEGGAVSDNGRSGIITGGDSKNGRVVITGGTIENNGEDGVGFHCPGPSYFTMTGGTIKNNVLSGLYLRGTNSEMKKTGGIIYGKNSGDNSNVGGAINLHFTSGTGMGGTSKNFENDASDSQTYAAVINAEETDVVAGSLQPETGWN